MTKVVLKVMALVFERIEGFIFDFRACPAAFNQTDLWTWPADIWGIENKSHYVRDVTFDEDRSQVRKKSGPRLMATLRNFAISILRLIGYHNIAAALRDMAAKPHISLKLIGL